MKVRKITIGLSLGLVGLVLYLSPAFSQGYTLKTYTTDEGLPHNNVRHIISDSSGFLWISTWDGLSRYDGYTFKNYYHIPGDTSSLPFFSVSSACIDSKDNLMVLADNKNVVLYNRVWDNFTPLKKSENGEMGSIQSLCTDNQGFNWMISPKALYRYNYNSGTTEQYLPDDDIQLTSDTSQVFSIITRSPDTLLLLSTSLFRFKIDYDQRRIKLIDSFRISFNTYPFSAIVRGVDHVFTYNEYLSPKGNIWLFSSNGLFRIDQKRRMAEKVKGDFPLEEFRGRPMFYWGKSDGGAFLYRPGGNLIELSKNTVQLLKNGFCQGNDIFWYAGTSFNGNSEGLTRLILTPDYFKNYSPVGEGENLPAVFSVMRDRENNLWIGMRGRDYITIYTAEDKEKRLYTPASLNPSYYGAVRTLIPVNDGIWIGYFYKMLLYYDYKTGKITRHTPDVDYFRAVVPDGRGRLCLGTDNLVLYDPETGISEHICDTMPTGGSFRFKADSKGIIWGGMGKSTLLRYDPSKGSILTYNLKTDYNIEDICEGDSGSVWLAKLGGGLVRFFPETGAGKTYTVSSGLSNNTTYSILRDRSGYIWVSTNNGISRLNPGTGICKKFGPQEGLKITEFNSGASFKGPDGEFIFGGMGGAVSFYPDSINMKESTETLQRLIILKLSVSGEQRHPEKPVYYADTTYLNKGDDNFQISFSSTDFTCSERTLYRYMTSGIDKNWITPEPGIRSINYSNLRPGIYTFSLEATDRNGEWTASRDLTIIIKPFFYQTKIFLIILIVFIFGLFHLIISLYLRNFRIKARHIQDELRLKALRSQMNPHFIFNSLNSINYFISNNDKLSANRYIADFSRLIRSILSNMGRDYVSLDSELTSIKDYLEIEHLRFGDKFDYELNTTITGNKEGIEVFPGLVQPFIENAIWHGVRALKKRKGFVSVRFTEKVPGAITCSIEDDGIGREASLAMKGLNGGHQPRGIGIVKERLELMNKITGMEFQLEITDLNPDAEEKGTRVRIDIPAKPHKD